MEKTSGLTHTVSRTREDLGTLWEALVDPHPDPGPLPGKTHLPNTLCCGLPPGLRSGTEETA